MPMASADCSVVLIVSFSILDIFLAGKLTSFPPVFLCATLLFFHLDYPVWVACLALWSGFCENIISRRTACSCHTQVAYVESHRDPKRWEPLPQTWVIWEAKGGWVGPSQDEMWQQHKAVNVWSLCCMECMARVDADFISPSLFIHSLQSSSSVWGSNK